MIIPTQKIDEKRLNPLINTQIPVNWLFLDTETKTSRKGNSEIHVFRLGWICLWTRKQKDTQKTYTWTYFENRTEFNKYIEKTAALSGKLIIIGHNIYFDLQVSGFFYYFTHRKWQLDFLYDRSSTFILKCHKDKKYIVALSSTNWFDQSLSRLGKLIGVEKMEVDFEKCTQDELKIYCRRDVEILVKIMKYYTEFIRNHRLGRFSFTKASQAFSAYRFAFMKLPIMIHREKNVIELERQSYMGGRTECFQMGKVSGGPFVTLDINSMYSYVMKNYEYPYKLSEYVLSPSVERIKQTLKKFCVTAQVEIITPEPVFAVRYNKKIVFPTGHFCAYLSSRGLKYAIDRGYVKSIERVAIYRRRDLFSTYVDYFHGVRSKYKKKDNEIMELLCKYMQNSLYGKWAQKNQKEKREPARTGAKYFREEILDMVTGHSLIKTYLMNRIITQHGEEEGKNSFVAIAAHVSENARLLLWDIIKAIGPERVLYCDTDSIKIRKSDLKYVNYPLHADHLGHLKIENESSDLFIGGLKYYVTEKNRHIKGIPLSAKEVERGVYEFLSWPKMTYHLRREIITSYHRVPIKRRINLNYDKGIVMNDGKVIPFCFSRSDLPPLTLQPSL